MGKYKNQIITCPNCGTEFVNKRRDRLQKFCSHKCGAENRHRNNGLSTFNVENWKLNKYTQSVKICEICGKEETANSSIYQGKVNRLARDHDHNTGNFRGLLCSTCNRALGWYENNIPSIHKYLENNSNFNLVIEKINKHIGG